MQIAWNPKEKRAGLKVNRLEIVSPQFKPYA